MVFLRQAWHPASPLNGVHPLKADPLHPPTIPNRVSEIPSDLHIGHLPGVLSLSLFLKTKPQPRHLEGSVTNLNPPPVDLATWGRCSSTSFSIIPTALDISLAVNISSMRASKILWRTVPF